MVEKELGERNFGFDSLKSRLNRDMQEEGIIARDCLPTARCSLLRDLHHEPATRRRLPRDRRCLRSGGPRWRWRSAVRCSEETIPGNNSFLLHVAVQSVGYFRLMWKWKNQRRRRTRPSHLRFIISSRGAHSFWP